MICNTLKDAQEKTPPPSQVVIPMIGKDNSINFTSSALTLLMVSYSLFIIHLITELHTSLQFTPDKQQSFRVVTAEIISSYCSVLTCNLVLMDGTVR